MKVQYASDIHLEQFSTDLKYEELISPSADVLCLVGDICPIVDTERWIPFLKWLDSTFSVILFVFGNHEFFIMESQQVYTMEQLKILFLDLTFKYCKKMKILDNTTYTINNTTFIGTTLWSKIPKNLYTDIKSMISDYHYIYKNEKEKQHIVPSDINELHSNAVNFIIKSLVDIPIENKIVVLSHHAPLKHGTSHPRYQDSKNNHAFSSDQSELMEDTGITAWIFGHTHYCADFRLNSTLILSNPGGYLGENTGYVPEKTLTI